MGIVHRFLLLATLAASPPASVDALRADPRPVRMTASGGIQVDLKRKIGVATKDVVVTRDDVTVCCDRAEAVYDKNQIRKVTCKGRVVILRPDGTTATADEAVFEAIRNALTLKGGAEVWTKDAHLVGKRIVYDIGKDTLRVEGGKSRFTFDPEGQTPKKPRRACPPPKASKP